MKTVSSSCAREHLPELLKAVSQGERIVIQLHKRAIAELGPPSAPQRPVPKLGTGKGKGKIIDPRWADPLTDEEMEAFIEPPLAWRRSAVWDATLA